MRLGRPRQTQKRAKVTYPHHFERNFLLKKGLVRHIFLFFVAAIAIISNFSIRDMNLVIIDTTDTPCFYLGNTVLRLQIAACYNLFVDRIAT